MKKIMLVFGTRPEAIKMAPLALEMAKTNDLAPVCCVTAQHREMLDSMLEVFQLIPDYDLNIMQPNQTLSAITSRTLLGLDNILNQTTPDMLLVHGDTTTALGGALAGFYHKIPVGHVEAGLRSFDSYSPYPEEMNRILVDDIASLSFSPTAANAQNLLRESAGGQIFVTGNTVIDAMKYTVKTNYRFLTTSLNELDYIHKKIIVVTCHRRENYGKPMEDIFAAVRDIVLNHSDVEVVYPVHLSPTVQECAHRILGGIHGIHLIQPLNVEEMHNLLSRCYLVMTDSGGLQEEAPALGKPVLVLRRETERPEAVTAGTVKLSGISYNTIYADAHRLLTDEAYYQSMARAVNPYGDAKACERIIDAIRWHFNPERQRPADFKP